MNDKTVLLRKRLNEEFLGFLKGKNVFRRKKIQYRACCSNPRIDIFGDRSPTGFLLLPPWSCQNGEEM